MFNLDALLNVFGINSQSNTLHGTFSMLYTYIPESPQNYLV